MKTSEIVFLVFFGILLCPSAYTYNLFSGLFDTTDSTMEPSSRVSLDSWRLDHDGKEFMCEAFPVDVETLFELLYNDQDFQKKFSTAQNFVDVKQSPWQLKDDGSNDKYRNITYTVVLSNIPGYTHCYVTETQVVTGESNPGEVYLVDLESHNSGFYGADNFYVTSHLFLSRETDKETLLCAKSDIKFKRFIFILNDIIKGHTLGILEKTFKSLSSQLHDVTHIMAQSKIKITEANDNDLIEEFTEAGMMESTGKENVPQCEPEWESNSSVTLDSWNWTYDGQEMLCETFPVDVDTLFSMLFTKSEFYDNFYKAHDTVDVMQSPWQLKDDGSMNKYRTVTFTVLPSNFKFNNSEELTSESIPCQSYIVNVESYGSGFLNANNFYTISHFFISRITNKESKLCVKSAVKFKEFHWIVNDAVEKKTLLILESGYKSLGSALRDATEAMAQRVIEITEATTKKTNEVTTTIENMRKKATTTIVDINTSEKPRFPTTGPTENPIVDGIWSNWSSFTKCSVTCGIGFHVAYRHCTGPQFRMRNCVGESHKYEDCKIRECEVSKLAFGSKCSKNQNCKSEVCSRGKCGVNISKIMKFPLYRYLRLIPMDHMYTTNPAEIGITIKGRLGRDGYWSEGEEGRLMSNEEGLVPLYRYYNGFNHFYTTNENEIGTTIEGATGNFNYKCEGIAGYCSASKLSGTIPLHRYFNGVDHFYTTKSHEIGTTTVGQMGLFFYKYEGVACYVFP